MDYIPEPPPGRVELRLKADGKFGREDPLNWPQVYSHDPKINFMSCIPRQNTAARRDELWVPLNEGDCEEYRIGNSNHLVTVKAQRLEAIDDAVEYLSAEQIEYEGNHEPNQQLRWLITGAQLARDRLSHPGTRRDLQQQLVCVERHYCLTVAWLIWRDCFEATGAHAATAITGVMGCFTTDGEVVGRLSDAGIPVWYLRLANTLVKSCGRIVKVVELTPPLNITTTNRDASTMLYSGPPGPRMLGIIYHNGHVCADVEAVALPDDYAGEVSLPSGSTSQLSSAGGEESTGGVQRRIKESSGSSKPCK